MNDSVNHPSHYTDGKIEVIDFIEDKRFGYHLGNAIKYISRAGKKDPNKETEDLRKAIWYIEHHIERRNNEHQERLIQLAAEQASKTSDSAIQNKNTPG